MVVVFVSNISVDGISIIWPIDKLLVVKLFNCFNCSTVVLYFLAIAYKVYPLWIIYFCGVVISINSVDGNFNICPIEIVFVVKLFNCFNFWTVVLFLVAIE